VTIDLRVVGLLMGQAPTPAPDAEHDRDQHEDDRDYCPDATSRNIRRSDHLIV
jgi:hypothetical protein